LFHGVESAVKAAMASHAERSAARLRRVSGQHHQTADKRQNDDDYPHGLSSA
jgi:hypothetical protein